VPTEGTDGTPDQEVEGALPPAISSRDALIDAVALEVAAGTRPGVLAKRFEYTLSGMHSLVASPAVQERVHYYRKRLEWEKDAAQKKVLLQLGDLTDAELKVAIPKFEDGTPPEVQWKALIHPASQRARHYLMDKVWPTVQRVDHAHEVAVNAGTTAVMESFVTLMERLDREQEARTVDILASPHVKEGADALPSPLASRQLAEENRR
jgi:hypothetical protein